MADTKISALPASTTPLTGTEVLPVVQGGATKQVSVANLTAGRAVSMLSTTVTGNMTLNGALASDVGLLKNTGQGYGVGSDRWIGSDGTTSVWFYNVPTGGKHYFSVNNTNIVEMSGSDLKVITGNLIQGTAAKGVNFTANTPAAGMTSQLLNWYEEGTFTAALTCGTSGTITLDSNENTLSYTRIGRVVYVSGQVAISAVSSPTGTVTLGTLPFAAASLPQRSESALFNVLLSNTTTNTPTFFGRINVAGATSITILAKDNTGALNASPASLFAGGADVWISGFYLV